MYYKILLLHFIHKTLYAPPASDDTLGSDW